MRAWRVEGHLTAHHHRVATALFGQTDVACQPILAAMWRGACDTTKNRGGKLHAVTGPDHRKAGGKGPSHQIGKGGGAVIIGVPFNRRPGEGNAVKSRQAVDRFPVIGSKNTCRHIASKRCQNNGIEGAKIRPGRLGNPLTDSAGIALDDKDMRHRGLSAATAGGAIKLFEFLLMRQRGRIKITACRKIDAKLIVAIGAADKHRRVDVMLCLADMRRHILHIQANAAIRAVVWH